MTYAIGDWVRVKTDPLEKSYKIEAFSADGKALLRGVGGAWSPDLLEPGTNITRQSGPGTDGSVGPTPTHITDMAGRVVTNPAWLATQPRPVNPGPVAGFFPQSSVVTAKKHDDNKPAYHLLPPRALEAVAKVFAYGSVKYTSWNYLNGKGLRWTQLSRAAIGHVVSWAMGESLDPESQQPHLAHAACSLLMLLESILVKVGTDDRWRMEAECVRLGQVSTDAQANDLHGKVP